MRTKYFRVLRTVSIVPLALLAFAGCGKTKPSLQETKIGVLVSQTGPIAPYGKKALEGIAIAQEKLRADGIPISFIVEDAASAPKAAVSGFEKLATVDRVPLVIGPESSGLAMALAPVANQRGVVLFAPTVATDAYSSSGDFTFRNWPSSKSIADKMADVALAGLKLKKVAVVHINNEMGKSYQIAFNARFTEGGGTVSITESYPPDTTEFRQLIANVSKAKPEAIYIVGQVEMGYFLRQMREANLTLPVLSGIAIEDPKVKEIAGNLIDGIIYTTPGFDPKSSAEAAKRFEDAFAAKHGRPAEIFAACSYDAAMIVGKLIQDGKRSAEDLKAALFQIKGFAGATGNISFDKNGDVQKPISLKKVVAGTFVFLDDNLQPLGK